jgi:hypothetical protein
MVGLRIALMAVLVAVASGPLASDPVTSGPSVAFAIVPSVSQPAAEVPEVYVTGEASCDVSTGRWLVLWSLNPANGPWTVTGVRDPVNNLALTPVAGRNPGSFDVTERLAGTATAAGLTFSMTTPANPVARSQSRTMALPGGCEVKPLTACPSVNDARYSHTFDPATGQATIMVANGVYCSNYSRRVFLAARLEITAAHYGSYGYPLQVDGPLGRAGSATLPGWVSGIEVLQVDTVPCGYQLYLTFDFPAPETITGGPVTLSRTLGAPNPPGNLSTGPVGSFAAPTHACTNPSVPKYRLLCGGGLAITLANGPDAPLVAAFEVASPQGGDLIPVPPGGTGSFSMTAVLALPMTIFVRVAGVQIASIVLPKTVCVRGRALPVRPPIPRRSAVRPAL